MKLSHGLRQRFLGFTVNPMKFRIHHFQELPSTNSLALQYASAGAAEGLVLVADYQSSGRGKPGRKWLSPAGKNLLFSLLIRPPIPPHRAPLLTQIACRSIAAILKKSCRLPTTFKRPNDLMVRGKKICGVLVETSSKSNGHIESAVIGIGLNVNASSGSLLPTATSIRAETGKRYDRRKLLQRSLAQIKKDLKGIYAHHPA